MILHHMKHIYVEKKKKHIYVVAVSLSVYVKQTKVVVKLSYYR